MLSVELHMTDRHLNTHHCRWITSSCSTSPRSPVNTCVEWVELAVLEGLAAQPFWPTEGKCKLPRR